jgi:pimeloyl-ACP methyl ester carboxylesterase
MNIQPFALPYSQAAVDDLRSRLAQTRWPDEIPGSGWEYGADLSYMKQICTYWKDQFDWKAQIDRMSRFHHFRYTDGSGLGVHFIHQRGKGPAPLPLVITHGWPGSFLEMLKIIPMLTDPGAHGGDRADSFDVVVPSLPGYGFSDRPTQRGTNTFRIAELWAGLMSELGYRRFGAQGGDWGANVSSVLGLRHPEHLIGVHLNFSPGSYLPYVEPGEKISEEAENFLEHARCWDQEVGAYGHIQETEPQTVAYALNDSPAGLAAWILEKFRDWADCDGDLRRRFTDDELLSNVTLYWMTQTIHSSCRLYYEVGKAPLHFQKGEYVGVPCGMAHFPKEDPFPPRSWIERGYNIQHWTEMPSGGHFAACEEPELLVNDIREFFRPLR